MKLKGMLVEVNSMTNIKKYQKKCFNDYKSSVGLNKDYNFFYGNPINPVVPIETAINGIMIVGAYPSAKFGTINGVTDVPLYNIDMPFSFEVYFDGSRVRTIDSSDILEKKYLEPLGISRSRCWITNLVKVFLLKEGHVSRYNKLEVTGIQETRSRFKEFAKQSLKWLYEEIKIAKPRVIFLLDKKQFQLYLGYLRRKL